MVRSTEVDDSTTGVQHRLELHTPSINLLPHLHCLRVLGSLYVISNDDINVGTNDHTGDAVGNHRGIFGSNRSSPNIKPERTVSVSNLSVGDKVVEFRNGLDEFTA